MELTPNTIVKLSGWNYSRGGQPCPIVDRYTRLKYLKFALPMFVETYSEGGWNIETTEIWAEENGKKAVMLCEALHEIFEIEEEYAYAEKFFLDTIPDEQQILFRYSEIINE